MNESERVEQWNATYLPGARVRVSADIVDYETVTLNWAYLDESEGLAVVACRKADAPVPLVVLEVMQ